MLICVNKDSAFPESDVNNNCMEHNFGPLLNVNLDRYAAAARWQSSTGALSWPMTRELKGDWAQVACSADG